MTNINTIIAISYIVIQASIAIFVSIVGAVHVKRCMNESPTKSYKSTVNNALDSDNLTIAISSNELNEQKAKTPHVIPVVEDDLAVEIKEKNNKQNKKGFCELWIRTVWKLKSVYGGLAVHSFDFLTDVLVIVEWLKADNIKGDHIDPQAMAYSAIFIMIFSKFISAIAIYVKEESIIRAILQFMDLLIFTEIFATHRKVISQVKNKQLKDKNKSIESTLSFKYIRNFEAVFESIPESVLQLVYVMRTKKRGWIFIVSIIQSIISMTNSILNNDYTQMLDDKFKRYKQRLPPTLECLKHSLCRLCEIIYRIGLLALFWTVCGGLAFGILLFIEFVIIFL
eukprot:444410_1